jgi:hypothetical protein
MSTDQPRRGILAGLLALASCDTPLPPARFAAPGDPELAPERYFEGHTLSWGVFEDAGGAPTSRFTTDAHGRREGNTLLLDQTIRLEDETIERSWRLTRLEGGRYEATAAPVVGIARGEATGRHFHWAYTIVLPPGGWLRTVHFEHWMYLHDDGETLLNRFTVRKLGLVVARASEVFRRLA